MFIQTRKNSASIIMTWTIHFNSKSDNVKYAVLTAGHKEYPAV